MSQVKQELQTAYIQELFTTIRDKCFEKCIQKPGTSLSSGESSCIAKCSDRYMDATKVIAQTVVQQSQKIGQ